MIRKTVLYLKLRQCDDDDNDYDDDAEEQVPSPTQGELHYDI